MDDFLSRADDIKTTKERRDQLINLLKSGGCMVKKWVSNDPSIFNDLPPEDRLRPTFLQLSTEGADHQLGISWDTHQYCFRFAPPTSSMKKLTKRVALAELDLIFDPVGWLAPLTLTAKIVIQDMWLTRFE